MTRNERVAAIVAFANSAGDTITHLEAYAAIEELAHEGIEEEESRTKPPAALRGLRRGDNFTKFVVGVMAGKAPRPHHPRRGNRKHRTAGAHSVR